MKNSDYHFSGTVGTKIRTPGNSKLDYRLVTLSGLHARYEENDVAIVLEDVVVEKRVFGTVRF